MYADQCLFDCQRLNAESVHSSQLCRPSSSKVMVNGVACFGACRFTFPYGGHLPCIFRGLCHSSNENLKLTQIKTALFCPHHLKLINILNTYFVTLQVGKSRVRFLMEVIKFFIYLIGSCRAVFLNLCEIAAQ